MYRLSEVGKDEMFGPVLRQGLRVSNWLVENTVTTDADKVWQNSPALFVQNHYSELSHSLFASFDGSQICMVKLASMHRTTNICLNQKHLLADVQNVLAEMKCLKNLVVAKRASKDRLLKLSHVRQTMSVSFARP